MSLFAELKRRNVFRMAGLYVVGAWLMVQVADTLLPVFDTPAWVLKALVLLLALGFVPALIFSWAFELTPDGLRRDSEVDHSKAASTATARRLDLVVIVLLLGVGAILLFRTNAAPPAEVAASDSAAANHADASDTGASATGTSTGGASATDPASIAVLPFADLSQSGDQAYFSDGMSEEILNVLTRVKGLQVASRTSSFAFKGQENLGIPAIARQLDVRHVLEGSVRRAGGTIRITAQLIDADVDRHLWSETFDRPLTAENVFAIQDEIAKDIVSALVKSLPGANVGDVNRAAATTNLSAYDSYLQARSLVRSRRQLELADRLLQTSLEQDPMFAPAWELRAALQPLLDEYTETPLTAVELERRSFAFADRALAITPNSALALAVKANLRSRAVQKRRATHDMGEVIADFQRSLEIDPNNADTLNWLGLAWAVVGQPGRALDAFQRCMRVDPQASACTENEYDALFVLGRYDEAWQHYLAAFDHGAITDQYTNFLLLARFRQEAAFMFASNQSKYLPRWRRHKALYAAFQDLDANHDDLVNEVLAFTDKQGIEPDNGFVGLILIPLGAHDLLPFMPLVWGKEYGRYRQSTQFRSFIRASGILGYWQRNEFPEFCRPVEPDEFHCD